MSLSLSDSMREPREPANSRERREREEAQGQRQGGDREGRVYTSLSVCFWPLSLSSFLYHASPSSSLLLSVRLLPRSLQVCSPHRRRRHALRSSRPLLLCPHTLSEPTPSAPVVRSDCKRGDRARDSKRKAGGEGSDGGEERRENGRERERLSWPQIASPEGKTLRKRVV